MTDYQLGFQAALQQMQHILKLASDDMMARYQAADFSEKAYYLGAVCAYTGAISGAGILLGQASTLSGPIRKLEPSIN